MTAISLLNVHKTFGSITALDSVSLTIPHGSFTAIVGRSGCGKSTLLKLCNGLEQPDSGSVQLGEQVLDSKNLETTRRNIGYAVQGTGLFPHLDIASNIGLLARLENWTESDIKERVAELLRLMQLPGDIVTRYPHELSGGQQQRVGLCRAMMLRPPALLLDEPFAAIDPLTRRDIHQHMLQLHAQEPCTTVLVTHDMQEAMLLADTIVVMDSGSVVQQLSTQALRHRAEGKDPEAILLSLIPDAEP